MGNCEVIKQTGKQCNNETSLLYFDGEQMFYVCRDCSKDYKPKYIVHEDNLNN